MEFKDLGVSGSILDALKKQNYTNPTPIQEQTIPVALQGKDILGLAQTGTGKTASFAIPTLQRLNEAQVGGHPRPIRALVLTPTRELALQVHESFETYGEKLPLRTNVIFGGVGQGKQVQALNKGTDILIATPGRLIDLVNQSIIDLSSIEIFILDEADRMLDMGFIRDVKRIMKLLPKKKQTLLFSATMPKEMEDIAAQVLHKPTVVEVTPVSSTAEKIEQYVYFVDKKHKIDLVADFFKENKHATVLIFARTKRGCDKIAKDLSKRKLKAKAIHGDKSQNARVTALEEFKTYQLHALVATDIASRGIDIQDLQYVINYDLPEFPETYVHRIGRTGRAGNEGIAISLCSFQEKGYLKQIEKLINKSIEVKENDKYPMEDFSPKQGRTRPNQNSQRSQNKEKPQSETKKKSNPQNNGKRHIKGRSGSSKNNNSNKQSNKRYR